MSELLANHMWFTVQKEFYFPHDVRNHLKTLNTRDNSDKQGKAQLSEKFLNRHTKIPLGTHEDPSRDVKIRHKMSNTRQRF